MTDQSPIPPTTTRHPVLQSPPPPARWLILLGLSLPLAWLLEQARFPGALFVGPMLVGVVFGVGGSGIFVPRWAFIGAQAVVGCLVAQAVTATIVASIAADWALMLLVVAVTILAGGVVGWVLARFGSLPGSTAAWGSSPGGASAMVAMAEDFGADVRLVGFMQYLRVVIVVVTASLVARLLLGAQVGEMPVQPAPWDSPLAFVPLDLAETLAIAILGSLIGIKARVPAGALLGPLLIGAGLHSTELVRIELPPWLLAAAYTALGWYIGLRFTREVLLYALRALPQLIAATFLLIGLCAATASLLCWFLGIDPLTAYLATSPGGLDAIVVIAVGSGSDVPFVLAFQTLRLLAVLLTGPLIAKAIMRCR